MTTASQSERKRKSTVGSLSVALPIISGVISFMFADAIMNSAFTFWLLLSTPLWAFLFAVISLVRCEPRPWFGWIGLVLNSGIAAFLFYGLTHLHFNC